jgi:hypothetical protein
MVVIERFKIPQTYEDCKRYQLKKGGKYGKYNQN